jgi:hypothetical protein
MLDSHAVAGAAALACSLGAGRRHVATRPVAFTLNGPERYSGTCSNLAIEQSVRRTATCAHGCG